MSTDTSARRAWEPFSQPSSAENGTEKRDSGFLPDAPSLEDKRSNQLTGEQAAEIVNAILASTTEDPNEFTSELEHRIIPVGFGLSLGELIYVMEADHWKQIRMEKKTMSAKQKIQSMIQKLADGGKPDPADWVYYRIDPDDERNPTDPEPEKPASPPSYLYAANQPNNPPGGPSTQQESNPADPTLQTQRNLQTGAHKQSGGSSAQQGNGSAHPALQNQHNPQTGAHNQSGGSSAQRGNGSAHPALQNQHNPQTGAHNQSGGSSAQQGNGSAHPAFQSQYSAQNGTRKFNAAETGTQHAAGSRQVFSVRAKKVQHQVTPGFTTSGEEIRYIQPLGKGRANFVVKSPDECYSLVDCSISGGPLAIEAAKNAGKPFTVSDEAKLKEYRELVTRGGQYGISFVAPGAWDASKKRMPFIVVGFYHVSAQDPNNTVEAAVSRSNLGKILKSPRQAEHMIVQCLGCESHWRLREALSFQFCMEAPLSATHINFPSQQPMAAPPNQPGPPNQQNHYYGGYSIPQRMAPGWNEQVPWWLQKPQQASHQFPTQETQSIPHQQPAGVYPQYMTEPVNWQQAFNYMSPAYQQQPFMMPYNPFHMVPQLQGLNPKQAIPQDLPSLGQPIQ